jgi:hypothetical protein
MKAMTFKRSQFNLAKFLAALDEFSREHAGGGNPLPGLSGGTVYFDTIDLIEALASDKGDGFEDVPDDSLGRLEMSVSIFGYFGLCNGWGGFDCADGQEVEVPNLDEDEDEEPEEPRRRRTKKFIEAVNNTPCDENSSFGYLIRLNGDTVEIEGHRLSDLSGEGELERLLEPNLIGDVMRRWVKTFCKKGAKS